MNPLQHTRDLIEDVVQARGGAAYGVRLDADSWEVFNGSARGLISLVPDERHPDGGTIYVRFPVMRVPGDAATFYRRLLEINHSLGGRSAFSVDGDGIAWISAGRALGGLDAGEIEELVAHAAVVADFYDDILLDRFGREWAVGQ